VQAEKALADAKASGEDAAKIKELEEKAAKEKKEAEEAAANAEKERLQAEATKAENKRL